MTPMGTHPAPKLSHPAVFFPQGTLPTDEGLEDLTHTTTPTNYPLSTPDTPNPR